MAETDENANIITEQDNDIISDERFNMLPENVKQVVAPLLEKAKEIKDGKPEETPDPAKEIEPEKVKEVEPEKVALTGNPLIDSMNTPTSVDSEIPEYKFEAKTKEFLAKNDIKGIETLDQLATGYIQEREEVKTIRKELETANKAVEVLNAINDNDPVLFTVIQKFLSGDDHKSYLKDVFLSDIDYSKSFDKQSDTAILSKYFPNKYDPDRHGEQEDFIEDLKDKGLWDIAKEKFDQDKKGKLITKESVSEKNQEKKEKFKNSVQSSINSFASNNPSFKPKDLDEIKDVMVSGKLFDMLLDKDGSFNPDAAYHISNMLFAPPAFKYFAEENKKKDLKIKELNSQIEEFVSRHGNVKSSFGGSSGGTKLTPELQHQIEALKRAGFTFNNI